MALDILDGGGPTGGATPGGATRGATPLALYTPAGSDRGPQGRGGAQGFTVAGAAPKGAGSASWWGCSDEGPLA